MKFPQPGDGGTETIDITSSVPNSPVTIAAHYKTTDHQFSDQTDTSGGDDFTFSIGRPTVGYPVQVDVMVGLATCSTSFPPR